MADWQKIKTEYITTDTSYRELSQKYGVHYTNIAKKASKEDWQQLRQQHTNTTQTKILKAIGSQQATRAARLQSVADKLLGKVEALVEASDPMEMDTQSMKHISGVLKDIKEIQMIRSEADMREQEARIANLRKQAEAEEKKDNTIVIQFAEGSEEYAR